MLELVMLLFLLGAAAATYALIARRPRPAGGGGGGVEKDDGDAGDDDAGEDGTSTRHAAQHLLDDAEKALAEGDRVRALHAIEDAVLLAPDDAMVLRRAEVLRTRVA